MNTDVRPQLLKLAREAAGLKQQDVVEALGVTQVTVSRWENGARSPSPSDLARLADLYAVTEEFFHLPERDAGLVAGDLHHRRRRGVKVGDVRRLEAQTNILRIGASRLLDEVEVEPQLHLPDLPIDEFDPEDAAREVRRQWNLPIGPIGDFTNLLELAGCIIVLDDFEIGLDGVSMWAGHWPILNVSVHAPPDRRRFTMAHELGHLVLHRDSYNDTSGEKEANRFAAEFLMPADQIGPKLRGLDLRKALALKLEWWVSVSALIMRARDVGAISAEDATRLHKQRSARGWTRHEPYGDALPRETPTTLSRVSASLRSVGYSDQDLATVLCRPDLRLHPTFRSEDRGAGRRLRAL